MTEPKHIVLVFSTDIHIGCYAPEIVVRDKRYKSGVRLDVPNAGGFEMETYWNNPRCLFTAADAAIVGDRMFANSRARPNVMILKVEEVLA